MTKKIALIWVITDQYGIYLGDFSGKRLRGSLNEKEIKLF